MRTEIDTNAQGWKQKAGKWRLEIRKWSQRRVGGVAPEPGGLGPEPGGLVKELGTGARGRISREAGGASGPNIRSRREGARGVLDVRGLSLCMLLSALSSALSSPNSCGFPSEALCVLLTCMCFPGLMKPRAAREMDQDRFQFSHVFPHRFLDGFLMDVVSIFDYFFVDFPMIVA